MFPAISVNRDVTVISDCSPPSEPVSPEGTQAGEYLPSSSHQTVATPTISPEERKLRM